MYSAEIIGCDHVPRTEFEALVQLDRDSRYRIRLSNANDHLCMVKVELDGVFIGEFLEQFFALFSVHRCVYSVFPIRVVTQWKVVSLVAKAQ